MSNRSAFGVILLGIGIIWLLGNFEMIQVPGLWNWLPILLVAFGIWRLFSSQLTTWPSSILIISVGIIIGLIQLNMITWSQISRAFWPSVIILIALNTIFPKSKTRKPASQHIYSQSTISMRHIFSKGQRTATDSKLKYGRIVTILGESDLDLSQLSELEGQLTIEVMTVLASVTLKIPKDWSVQDQTFILLGSSENKAPHTTTAINSDQPKLILKGNIVLGSVVIK